MKVAALGVAGMTTPPSASQSFNQTVTGVIPASKVLPVMTIGAYGFNGPELLKMCTKVMVEASTPSPAVTVLPVMLMSPMELG